MTTPRRIYLDWNATAPVHPAVAAGMAAHLQTVGNPSSVHEEGRGARRVIEAARASVAALVGAAANEVIFTSGGSEANALALRGLLGAGAESGHRYTRLFVSAVEHDSILATADALAEAIPGLKVSRIPVTEDGVADLDAFRVMMREGKGRTLVSVMIANNETGAIQPVAEIVGLSAEYGATVHTDAVQGSGKIDIDMGALGVHAMTLSAHKFAGPQGVGALVLRDTTLVQKQIDGGGQELGRRAGTENVAGIHGFGIAAKLASEEKASRGHLNNLRFRLESGIAARAADAVIYAKNAPRLPSTTCFGVPGLSAETTVIALDLAGIAVSAGSACSSGKVRTSHVLTAMGVPPEEASSAIRVSFGPSTSEEDIDHFIEAWSAHYRRVKHRGLRVAS